MTNNIEYTSFKHEHFVLSIYCMWYTILATFFYTTNISGIKDISYWNSFYWYLRFLILIVDYIYIIEKFAGPCSRPFVISNHSSLGRPTNNRIMSSGCKIPCIRIVRNWILVYLDCVFIWNAYTFNHRCKTTFTWVNWKNVTVVRSSQSNKSWDSMEQSQLSKDPLILGPLDLMLCWSYVKEVVSFLDSIVTLSWIYAPLIWSS